MTDKPKWIEIAESYVGTKEVSGPKNNSTVVNFWKRIGLSGISNDEVPWCAAFVGAVLTDAGFSSTHSGLAKSYLRWGVALDKPVYGCVVVFTRKGGGHVGFVVGQNKDGLLYVLGGNQSDAVSIKLFKKDNIVGYRWPSKDIPTTPPPVISLNVSEGTKVT